MQQLIKSILQKVWQRIQFLESREGTEMILFYQRGEIWYILMMNWESGWRYKWEGIYLIKYDFWGEKKLMEFSSYIDRSLKREEYFFPISKNEDNWYYRNEKWGIDFDLWKKYRSNIFWNVCRIKYIFPFVL